MGQTEPPNPWIVLDACELRPSLLPISAWTLGGPKPTLREVRRLGPRGCLATHVDGEVTLSVSPVPGRAEDLDGDEVAIEVEAAGDRCAVAAAMAEALSPALPDS